MPSSPPPPLVYWDACVLLAYVNGEPERTSNIRALLIEAERGEWEVVTSVYTITEVAFAAAEKDRRVLDPESEAKIDNLWRPPSPVKLAEFHIGLAESARQLLRTALERSWRLKPGDAIHLATAKELQVKALCTYNLKDFQRWAPVLGLDVMEPHPNQAVLGL